MLGRVALSILTLGLYGWHWRLQPWRSSAATLPRRTRLRIRISIACWVIGVVGFLTIATSLVTLGIALTNGNTIAATWDRIGPTAFVAGCIAWGLGVIGFWGTFAVPLPQRR